MAENRVYLSSIGLYPLFIFGGYSILGRVFGERIKKTLMILLFGGYSVFLGYLTLRRNVLYQDPVRIWSEVIRKYPNHQRAHKNLAVEFYKQGDFKQMVAESEKALSLDHDDYEARTNLAVAYYNLGRYKDALSAYQEILNQKPDYAPAYSNLGMLYERLSDTNRAISAYKNAINLDPTLIEPLNNLAGIYREQGHIREAAELYEAALRIDPSNVVILQNYNQIVPGESREAINRVRPGKNR